MAASVVTDPTARDGEPTAVSPRPKFSSSLPRWFEDISARGFEEGDQLRYRIYPQRLRTMLVSHEGKVLVDQTDRGEEPRRALLAGYFAPGTDTRTGLIESLGPG